MNAEQLRDHLHYKIPQIRLAILREPIEHPLPNIRTPRDLEQYLEPLRHMSEENFVCLHLNVLLQVTGFHVVSQGTVSTSLAHPREVFKAAILNNAYSIVVAHNHPSGSLIPSDDDVATTKHLIAAGEMLGIQLLDHLIVSFAGVASVREDYPSLFGDK